ncbi:MAG TPA: SDR family NAD(P)-dependent oxidoreductase [Woeseiaceae bacterium]|nr:SDR family NAD(P)-dependent oxidoreductase [Woeseiaceae bacterium]
MKQDKSHGRMADQNVVVTGGGSGIGAAITTSFRQQGARVTIIGRNKARLAEFAAAEKTDYEVADVTAEESVDRAFRNIAARQGPVTILINNAGAAEAAPFHKTDAALWHKMIAVNLNGVFHCSRAVIPGMLKNKRGRIVNVASTAALKGYAYVSAYCAAKHGVVGLTRAMALEYATRGITVNAVCPGYTDTDIVANTIENIVAATGRSAAEALAELVGTNPQGRLIAPAEVADTVLWLAGDESRAITGQAIAVAGGEIM